VSDSTYVLASLLGGVALLVFGIRMVGDGLQRAAGARLRHLLSTLTGSPIKGLLVGAGVTAVLQSSSATTVMLVGFASAGLLSLRQTIGVILGADVGTTLTVQLLAFNVLNYSLLVLFAGWVLRALAPGSLRYAGEAVFGFGLLFLAMKLLSEGVLPLKNNALVDDLILALIDQPVVLIAFAAAFTALVHSSAATIGLALSFASQDLLPLQGAMPIIFGANIGTAATAVAASIGARVEARRVALAHAGFKIVGVLLFLPFLGPFTDLVRATAPDLPRQIANAHTIFNVALAIIFLPAAGIASDVISRIVRERLEPQVGAIYLDARILETPALALGQATREILRMADLVHTSLMQTLDVFRTDSEQLLREVVRRDDHIDRLEEDIKQYLTRLRVQSLTEEQSQRETTLLFVITDLEAIGDVIDKNLMELAEKKRSGGHRFSDQGWREIADLHAKVTENLELAIAAFAAQDRSLAEKAIRHKGNINVLEREYRQTHIGRLHAGLPESIDTSSIHLDVLANLKRVNSLATNIAYAVLGYAVSQKA
jgi:phosphate:Na+ symporter